ncbi:DNA double-strand break repair ATPase Rad50 [Halostella salina]|uniref:DNA double-strand break repair ATPase Rad50 n=1 Tax=Halostella salina TaxID=1547897 RepID=UPI000EF7FE4C|nr:DNA double-strand break repair ATPase Rad50 [Halostella salina]
MKFERVSLRNFKCYGDAEIRLDPGVTVIHGVNGSGKSSLLEACFFALYGSKALDDRNLEDVITNGEEECEVELDFTHDGGQFSIERRVRVSGDRAKTANCVLETPDGTVEGATDVRERVASLLRMDHEAFVNCAYVRQGEVNKLIHASPSDRQDMIDDLLQLGKLEEYRERASEARLGVDDVLGELRGELSGLEERIESKEAKDLPGRLNELETERNEVTAEIERFEEQQERAEESLSEAEDLLAEHEAKREELDDVAADIADLRETISETEREREALNDRIADQRERRETAEAERDEHLTGTDLDDADPETIEARLDELDDEDDELHERIGEIQVEIQSNENEAENLRERADELESEAAEKREQAEELADEIEEIEATVAERREKADELAAEIETKRTAFDDASVAFGDAEDHLAELEAERDDLRDQRQDVATTLEAKRDQLAEAERLLDEGKCPECGQPVEDSPHVESIDDLREAVETLEDERDELEAEIEDLRSDIERAEELADAETAVEQLERDRENLQTLLSDKADRAAEKRDRRDELRERADELETEAAEKRETADEKEATADEKRTEIAEINRQRGDLRDREDRLESLLDAVETVADATETIEDLREKRESKAELNDERRERLAEKRDRKAELEDTVDEERIEEAKAEKERAENYLEDVESELAELRERRDDLIDRIGGVKNELDELDDLRETRGELEARRERLAGLYDEAERLQEMYGDLRAELRQRNVETLERMLNETFELVYQNDSYARIELDGGYELTVYQKDGEALEPEQLSGGERALFNLSLRCAIYRLLSEGIEGTAPMPPLILDEPTVFLDSGHVSRLVDLVESMRDLGVEQIIVVSHDDELVGAADDVVRVEKDATSNRSSVARERRALPTD